MLFRCGDSPSKSPDKGRLSDGLFALTAEADFDKGFAEFRLKSIFFQGEGEVPHKAPGLAEKTIKWLHQQYTKLMMESAMSHVKQ